MLRERIECSGPGAPGGVAVPGALITAVACQAITGAMPAGASAILDR
jgi:hypothetical protein